MLNGGETSMLEKRMADEYLEDYQLKIQRNVFMDDERDLNEAEYRRLLEAAKGSKNRRLYYVMVAICGTGIRVSELPFLTVEAVCRG